MPPEVVKYLPYVVGAAVTFGFYEFQMYRRRQKARRVAEDRQYAASGVYEGRLVELLGICGDMGLSDRQYAYIATNPQQFHQTPLIDAASGILPLRHQSPRFLTATPHLKLVKPKRNRNPYCIR